MTALAGGVVAFALALLTAPAGVSGAVFLLPFQVSVLGVPSPAVTPTNLLYNVLATPGALVQYRRSGRLDRPLARLLLAGTLPGVVVGAVLRVELLDSTRPFLAVVAAVLVPLGVWLLLDARGRAHAARPAISGRIVGALAFAVGVIGGIYGVGGGSMLAPLLLALGYPIARLAGAALLSTFVTSVVGVVTFALLALGNPDTVGPDWSVGVAIGAGGLLGSNVGARVQPHLPETLLRGLLGALAVGIGAHYAWVAAGG